MAMRSVKCVVVGDGAVGESHKFKLFIVSLCCFVSCKLDFETQLHRKDVLADLLHTERVSTRLRPDRL